MRASRRGLIVLAVLGAGAVGVPAAAGAPAPFAVQVGGFDPPRAAELDAFYPRNAIVREGDSLTFKIQGFHTVVFPPRGQRVPEFLIPTGTAAATNDAAGAPYWWAGLPTLGLNAIAAGPTAAKAVTGRQLVNSGLAPGLTVTFPKRGSYRVFCGVHRAMVGKVTVKPKKAKVPSGASQKARAAREVASDLKAVRRTIRQARAATRTGTQVQMPGRTRLSILNFFPKAKTVAPGTVVTFRMTGRNEFHTVTFGPPAFLDGFSFELPPGTPFDPQATYPTDPPGPTPALSPTSHGNGFLNSGILTDPGYPLQAGPHSFRVRFDTPGDYDYRCLLHPDMRGRISVA